MRDFEGNRGQGSSGKILEMFVATYPVLALMVAFHSRSAGGNHVAKGGLFAKGFASGLPVLQITSFKIKVQGRAILIQGENALIDVWLRQKQASGCKCKGKT